MNLNIVKLCFPTILLLSLLCVFSSPSAAREKIISFHSDIEVHEDSTMTVTENITVKAEGNQIKRGIYREFPTRYQTPAGIKRTVNFDVIDVLHNNAPTPYHLEKGMGNTRVYIGSENVFIPYGQHRYTIKYKTSNQIGYFDDFDELAWDVTGNGWAFDIESVVATISVPSAPYISQQAAYTGKFGSKEAAYKTSLLTDNRILFETTRTLHAGEGLTVSAGWRKGYVYEPTAAEKRAALITSHRWSIMAAVFFLILTGYYLSRWNQLGRDPEKDVIIPLFHPPADMSPGLCHYIMNMSEGDSMRAFTAAIMSVATKGYWTIKKPRTRYTLALTGQGRGGLSKAEKAMGRAFFGTEDREDDSFSFNKTNSSEIVKARKDFTNSLKKECGKLYFHLNRHVFWIGGLLSVVIIGGLVQDAREPEVAIFMTIWLSVWLSGTSTLVYQIYNKFRQGQLIGGGGLLLFALPFIGGAIFGIGMLAFSLSVMGVIGLLLLIALNSTFWTLMKRPTIEGRAIMDQIEGFKMYLSTAEKDRLEFLHPPEMTPEIFEKYLPYAYALGVENEWSEKFEDEISKNLDFDSDNYHPHWYHSSGSFNSRSFASSMGSSLSSSIASSSSSSSGGGSSGGGGGGGGGGGW